MKLAVRAAQGGERAIGLAGAGASFGEIAVFLDQPCVSTAGARADARLVRLAGSSALEEFGREPGCTRGLAAALSRPGTG
ncbi:MAG TPA: cyclic nucleotide-binding domain-containing protein [Burkholderiales bacterium]|nr:cyclic nucleotide-binding domain-containing protein [Burkholderiales bacterium]